MINEDAAKLTKIVNSTDFYVRVFTSNLMSSGLVSQAWEEDSFYWYTTSHGEDAYKLNDVGLTKVQIFGLVDTDDVLRGMELSQC